MEFDRDEALATAIKVFSSHGYEGSSTATLLERMGIARQSLYGTFSDKRRLFLEALKRHNAESLAEIIAPLNTDLPCLEALEASLLAFARPGADPQKGCLGVGSIAEFGREDPDINAINDASGQELRSALARRVRDGITAGEVAADIDPDHAAHFLLTVRSGLKIAARGCARREDLQAMVAMALRGLRA
jgi:AcrR family transcriptional regulator